MKALIIFILILINSLLTMAAPLNGEAADANEIGKVFHDRDGDGIQDYAKAKDVQVEIKMKNNSDDHIEKIIIPQIEGRDRTTIRREIFSPDNVEKLRVTTKEGTDLTLLSDGKVIENHRDDKKAGMTSQEIQIIQRILRDKAGKIFLEIQILNYGIDEEGIPGVRLATVDGIVMETDGYGRYHLPPTTPEKDRNQIIKIDSTTLPKGTIFTTENPKVRYQESSIIRYNFGVKLPEL